MIKVDNCVPVGVGRKMSAGRVASKEEVLVDAAGPPRSFKACGVSGTAVVGVSVRGEADGFIPFRAVTSEGKAYLAPSGRRPRLL